MGKRIEAYHEDPVLQTFMVFMQVSREVAKYSDNRFFRGLNLSTVKYIVLKALTNNGGTLTNSDLAIWTDTKRHNITTLVKRMEIDGLVTTAREEEDKRFKRVTVTDKGRDLSIKANDIGYDLINRVMSGIDKQLVAQLDKILRIIRDNIQTASKE